MPLYREMYNLVYTLYLGGWGKHGCNFWSACLRVSWLPLLVTMYATGTPWPWSSLTSNVKSGKEYWFTQYVASKKKQQCSSHIPINSFSCIQFGEQLQGHGLCSGAGKTQQLVVFLYFYSHPYLDVSSVAYLCYVMTVSVSLNLCSLSSLNKDDVWFIQFWICFTSSGLIRGKWPSSSESRLCPLCWWNVLWTITLCPFQSFLTLKDMYALHPVAHRLLLKTLLGLVQWNK